MPPGFGKGQDEPSARVKCIEHFYELVSLEKRKLLVMKLETRVGDLFPDKEGEVIADNQKKAVKLYKYS